MSRKKSKKHIFYRACAIGLVFFEGVLRHARAKKRVNRGIWRLDKGYLGNSCQRFNTCVENNIFKPHNHNNSSVPIS
jgi:hypothetical protein